MRPVRECLPFVGGKGFLYEMEGGELEERARAAWRRKVGEGGP